MYINTLMLTGIPGEGGGGGFAYERGADALCLA